MNDGHIRESLIAYLSEQYAHQPDTLIVEEVCVRGGRSRMDLVLVSETLHGFEIKSQLDTLSRLGGQLEDYRAVFDELTVVIGLKHLSGVLTQIPTWCGVMLATWEQGTVTVEPFRQAELNMHREPYALAQLLWRDEALAVLEKRGMAYGVKSKPRKAIWRRLADRLATDELASEVRTALKQRTSRWRTDSRTTLKKTLGNREF
jgi:hypothetical protein